jgi:hypothetical protein
MALFQAHRDEILKFYESTSSIVHEHQQLYGKLVNKLNQNQSATHSLNGNLDEFMSHSFTEFNDFRTRIQSQPLDAGIQHTYDTNKQKYIKSFSLPDKKIIVKHSFKLARIGAADVVYKLNNGSTWGAGAETKPNTPSTSFKTRDYVGNKEVMETDGNTWEHIKSCNHFQDYNCCGHTSWSLVGNGGRQTTLYKQKEETSLEFWIDDYLNIYIPSLKTYLVYNYSKVPLYAFFINMDKLGMYNHLESGAIQFNENCPEDLAEYESIKSFMDSFGNFLTSKDERQKFVSLFPKLSKFYNYESKQKYFAQFQNLSEKLEHLAPSATRDSIVVDEEKGMSDEHKLFAQSQRIRELEIQAHKNEEELGVLRSGREQQIEVISEHQKNTEAFKILLEELNGQLHGEIDRSAVHQKTIISLKTRMLDLNELTHKYRKLEDSKQKIVDNMTQVEQELLEVKSLNNSLVDKQIEAAQKLDDERSKKLKELEDMKEMRLTIDRKDKELSNLSITLESERQLHEGSKEKLEKMFSSIQNSKLITDDYPKLLLKQIQDKNSQIEKLKLDKTKIEKSKKTIATQLSQLKSKVNSLIN